MPLRNDGATRAWVATRVIMSGLQSSESKVVDHGIENAWHLIDHPPLRVQFLPWDRTFIELAL